MRKPTLHQEVSVYRQLLHKIQLYRSVTMNSERVIYLLDRICDWSYAHRQGNGELSDNMVQRGITKAFWRLTENPETFQSSMNFIDEWKPKVGEPVFIPHIKEWGIAHSIHPESDDTCYVTLSDGSILLFNTKQLKGHRE